MTLSKRIGFVGIARQTVKGTKVSPPAFGMGVRGGGVMVAEIVQDRDGITYASRVDGDVNRTAINPGSAFGTRAYAKSIGLLLLAALGNDVVTGSGPFTHTITPAGTIPRLTAYGQLDTEYHDIIDCKVDQLTLTWATGPFDVDVVLKGATGEFYTSSWTPTNDESGQPRFETPGGLFKMDAASGTPAVADITGGSLTINNNLVPVPLSKSITPDDQVEAVQQLDLSLTLMPASTIEFRKALTGSGAGTTAQGTPVYGSFELKSIIDGNTDLDILSTRVAFQGDYPEVDPAGGPAELTLTAHIVKPAGAALTAVLRNTITAY